jgi:hypothetical protein
MIFTLLYGGGMVKGVFFKPYLTITLKAVSHTPYFNDIKDKKSIHNKIKRLYDKGLGYRKIHTILVKEGFDIGKSPSCMFLMIKKLEKRESILSQKTIVDLGNIEVKILRV